MSFTFRQPPVLPPDLHDLKITLDEDGLNYQLECRHEPFPERYACGAQRVDDFWEIFSGEKTTPHEGLIMFYWTGSGEDAEDWWRYATDDEIKAAEGLTK